MLSAGDHVGASRALYGGSITQLKHLFKKLSVELTFVDPDDPNEWHQATTERTRLVFGETIGNPGGNVMDIEQIAKVAHDHSIPLVMENTFATPYLCRPIEWGADIVIH